MCGHSTACHECSKEAVYEVFWHAWQGRYCEFHGLALIARSTLFGVKPVLTIVLET